MAPSDSNGVYSLPAGYLAVTGDTILPTQHNPPFEDVAAGLTARLMRSGAGPMTGPLKGADGAVGAPGYTFGSALTTGLYKTTAGFGVSIGGTLVAEFGAGGLLSGVQTVAITDQAVTYPKIVAPSAASRLLGSNSNAALSITGAANNGSGLIRLTVASTATFATSQKKIVAGVVGTTEANGRWTITVVDATHIDLQSSTFTNAYVSGGTIGGGVDEIQLGAGLSLSGATLSALLSATNLVGFLGGLELSTAGSSATFSAAIGSATDTTFADLLALTSAYSKTTSSWAVGSGNGALDTGAIAINTWYHVWLIKRPDTSVVDLLISLSVSAPTMPTNYTLKRRIGSIRTNGSSQWVSFTQVGDNFIWAVAVGDATATSTATSRATITLSVPTGVNVTALGHVILTGGGGGSTFTMVNSPLENDAAVSGSFCNMFVDTGKVSALDLAIMTNSSAQVSHRSGNTLATLAFYTYGWIDRRGK